MMIRVEIKRVAVLLISFLPFQAALGQSEQQMSQFLNRVDQPNSWQQVPVSGVPQGTATPTPTGVPAVMPQYNNMAGAQDPSKSPFTLKNIFKTMMGGGGGGSNSNPQDVQSALSSVREDLQTARDQESQARDACGAIGGESDKGVKQSLAEQAQNHANAAREAADRAYETSGRFQNGDISGIASEARGAANEAQAAADRARSNASGGGW